MTGDGTQGNPFRIYNWDDFNNQLFFYWHDVVPPGETLPYRESGKLFYVEQMADINFAGRTNWRWKTVPFYAVTMNYNGNNYRWFNINQTVAEAGVFYCVAGEFLNLRIEGSFTGTQSESGSGNGTFATDGFSSSTALQPRFENIEVNATCSFNGSSMGMLIGSLVEGGYLIKDVVIRGSLHAGGGTASSAYIGGFMGWCGGDVTIQNCCMSATRSGASGEHQGGFIGLKTSALNYSGNISLHNSEFSPYDNASSSDDLLAWRSGDYARTAEQLQQQMNYPGWNYSTIWRIWNGVTFPWNRAFTPSTTVVDVSPSAGGYEEGSQVAVQLTSEAGARIYYTLNGGDPTVASPFVISGNSVNITIPTTIRAFSENQYKSASGLNQFNYVSAPAGPSPVFNPLPGEYEIGNLSVVVTCDGSPTTLRYTLNGTEPDLSSPEVANGGTVVVDVPQTLRVKAWFTDLAPSQTTGNYLAAAGPEPVLTPGSGAYPMGTISVIVTCDGSPTVLRYTTDGNDPTESSPSVANGGTVNLNMTGSTIILKVRAWFPINLPSQTTGTYSLAGTVLAPEISPAGGAFVTSVNATASSVTPDSIIRYRITALGVVETPTESDPILDPSVTVFVPATLNVRAFRSDLNPSAAVSADYLEKVAAPILNPPTGSALSGESVPVTVTAPTSGSSMNYVIGDGGAPSETSGTPIASGSVVNVPVPNLLRVVAFKTGLVTSDVSSSFYYAENQVHRLPFSRFLRQVETNHRGFGGIIEAASDTYDLLISSDWVESEVRTSTLPPRDKTISVLDEQWDAFTRVGDVRTNEQRHYAGMVAYRFTIPFEAISNDRKVVRLSVPTYVDRWLIDGVRLAVKLSNSQFPSTSIDDIRNGDLTSGPVLLMQYDPLRSTPGNIQGAVLEDKMETFTLEFPTPIDATRYLYIYVTLENYLRTRGDWTEGGGAIIGNEVEVEFDDAVAGDLPSYMFRDVAAPNQYLTTLTTSSTSAEYNVLNVIPIELVAPLTGNDFDQGIAVNNIKAALLSQEVATPPSRITQNCVPCFISVADSPPQKTITVNYGVRMLQGANMQSGVAKRLIFRDPIPEYPDWIQMRLNVYFRAGVSENKFLPGGGGYPFEVADLMLANYASWAYGGGSGFTSVLSTALSPLGYPSMFRFPINFSVPLGIGFYYVSIQIVNILANPDLTIGSAWGLGPVSPSIPGLPVFDPTVIYLDKD